MALGWDNAMAIETNRGMATLLQREEYQLIGGNRAAISAPASVTATSGSASGTGFAVGTWNIEVTALTLEGCVANATTNSNVGESVKVATTVVVGAGGTDYVKVTFPVVEGAVGYKIYCSDSASATAKLVYPSTSGSAGGAMTYADGGTMNGITTGQKFVGVNTIRLYGAPSVSHATAPGSDGSANAYAMEGLIPWASKSTIYSQSVGTRIYKDLAGAALTQSGSSIVEFDYILQSLWKTWRTGPTLMLTSPAGQAYASNLLQLAGVTYYDIGKTDQGRFQGASYAGSYTNKFVGSMLPGQNSTIQMWAHPLIPDGTFVFLAETVPYQYAQVGRAFALDVLRPYMRYQLGPVQRSYPFTISFTEVLKCYHPLAQAIIQGARVE